MPSLCPRSFKRTISSSGECPSHGVRDEILPTAYASRRPLANLRAGGGVRAPRLFNQTPSILYLREAQCRPTFQLLLYLNNGGDKFWRIMGMSRALLTKNYAIWLARQVTAVANFVVVTAGCLLALKSETIGKYAIVATFSFVQYQSDLKRYFLRRWR